MLVAVTPQHLKSTLFSTGGDDDGAAEATPPATNTPPTNAATTTAELLLTDTNTPQLATHEGQEPNGRKSLDPPPPLPVEAFSTRTEVAADVEPENPAAPL